MTHSCFANNQGKHYDNLILRDEFSYITKYLNAKSNIATVRIYFPKILIISKNKLRKIIFSLKEKKINHKKCFCIFAILQK